MFLLKWRSNLLGMLCFFETLNEIDAFDFVDVVETSTAQEFAQNAFVAFESWNALFQRRIDDS